LDGTEEELVTIVGGLSWLNFWYAACPWLRCGNLRIFSSFPILSAEGGHDLALLGINTGDDASTAQHFVRGGPALSDHAGSQQSFSPRSMD